MVNHLALVSSSNDPTSIPDNSSCAALVSTLPGHHIAPTLSLIDNYDSITYSLVRYLRRWARRWKYIAMSAFPLPKLPKWRRSENRNFKRANWEFATAMDE
jgi:hypothetical protein